MKHSLWAVLLASCATVEAPTAPPGKAAPPVPLLQWDAAAHVVRCQATGTELPLPEAPADGVEVVGGDLRFGALSVSAGGSGRFIDLFLADWAALHRRVTSQAPVEVKIEGPATFGTGRMSFEYTAPPDTRRYALTYLSFERNGSTCRLAALDAPSAALLDGVRDAPGLDLKTPPTVVDDTSGWAAVNALLSLGSRVPFRPMTHGTTP